jgi:uncharacterized repeat protein (TIGR03803 family)
MRESSAGNFPILRRALAISGAAIVLALPPLGGASAYTQGTLHSFCTTANCGDGDTPRNGVLMDQSGDLYGTTEFGGKYNNGLVFKLIPNAKKTKYTEHILKNFCAKTGCTDGAYPSSNLIMDMDGDLYGTTEVGGKHGGGVVFKMRPVANGWVFSVIHSFCSQPPDCADGESPGATLAYAGQASGAPWDEASPLFGTANLGGANGKGIAYEISPNGSGWSYQVLHSFNSSTESAYPGPLLVDPSGNLLGVTYMGAKYGAGALYRLAAGTWTEATLHNFCADPNCTDGNGGFGRLSMDAAGNLFGTALLGGSSSNCTGPSGCGVAFERTAGGKYKVIYDFCKRTNCNDGSEPAAGMIMDASGNLLGTTHIGGKGNLGTVFMLTAGSKWTEQVLYSFCSEQNCADGAGPGAPVILDDKSDVYGTTEEKGANGSGGTVFELKP